MEQRIFSGAFAILSEPVHCRPQLCPMLFQERFVLAFLRIRQRGNHQQRLPIERGRAVTANVFWLEHQFIRLLTFKKRMQESCHHIDRMQLDRELSLRGLMVEEGFQSFLHRVILLQREQTKGGESKVARPAFGEVPIARVQNFLAGVDGQAARLNPGAQTFRCNEDCQRLLVIELFLPHEDRSGDQSRAAQNAK